MASTCAAGERVGSGACKRCGATKSDGCHIYNNRVHGAFDEMLAVLKLARERMIGSSPGITALRTRTDNIIAKAEGRTP